MITTIMSKELVVVGDLEHRGDIRIEGVVRGNVRNTDGTTIICESSKIYGDVHSEKIVLGGVVEGDIYSNGSIEILSTANLKGKIVTKNVLSHSGFKFKGYFKVD